MKYFIIAGEASGDLHGSNLIKSINGIDDKALVRCWGGDKMMNAGADLIKHYRDLAFMGFWEVFVNIRTIFHNLSLCKSQILDFKPDVVILIDYPGFNLRIARFLNLNHIKTYYYISPQIWAWKKSRIKLIREFIDRMYVILPFEPEFYNELNYKVNYFGHPLVDVIESEVKNTPAKEDFIKTNKLSEKPVMALLAGSRKQEVKKILPEMIKMVKYYSDYQFIVAGIDSVPEELYARIIRKSKVRILYGQTYAILKNCELALVASGTATLETALVDIPQVVCYRTSMLTYLISKWLIKVRFISLVNLIMDKEVVKELIQKDLNERSLNNEINTIIAGGWKREIMKNNYKLMKEKLAGKNATERIAKDIVQSLILVKNVN